LNSWF